jgi:hypothetical protein
VPYSLTLLIEGARVQIDLSQDGLQVVVAGTSGRVLLRKRILGRKMSPAAFREYNVELLQGNQGHVILSGALSCFAYAFVRGLFHWKSPVTSSTGPQGFDVKMI